MNSILTVKNLILGIVLALFDLAVYIFLGLLLMDYDDFYDERKGAYWSLESMTTSQKATYIGLNIWHVINLLMIGYIVYKLIRTIKNKDAVIVHDKA